LYTSGTTSKPKGVVHSHASILANLAAVRAAWRWTEQDHLLIALPMYHTHGLLIGALNALLAGGSLDLLPRFDAVVVLDRLAATRASLFFGVPTMYAKLVSLDSAAAWDLSAVRLWVSGSAPLPIDVFERFERLFGQRLLERYGMTETGMNLTNPYDGDRIPGSVGFAFPGIEVRCVSGESIHAEIPSLEDVPPGETGEIVVRGPNLFVTYLNRPDAYAEAFFDGWFMTGDLATRDDEGRFRIVGRASTDIIKSRGYKIGALEIEDVVARHPAVLEVAVIGVDHAEWGEAILAVVALRPGMTVTADELRGFCGQSLTHYKLPRWFEIVDEIPKTGPGKYKKRDLIDRYRLAYL
jgi:malonyl-CoA/methylmalonyl-CoA synthetase